MKVILQQSFPLGRFHATPWKVFPYDDPHGEWPPSPWRLIRAILARSHQLERESSATSNAARESLVGALAESHIAWRMHPATWRGPGLRQYQPAEFKKMPAAAREPGMFTYNTTKVQDNFWLTAGETQPLLWIFEGDGWSDATLSLLDDCLARVTYFGRAESITVIERVPAESISSEPNCVLVDQRTENSVPVLCPRREVTLEQLQVTTDDDAVRKATVPPGAVWRFAERPARSAVRIARKINQRPHKPKCLLQFALGSRVAPHLDHIALISNWLRGRAVRHFLQARGLESGDWKAAGPDLREAVSLLSGKGVDGIPLTGHRHTYFGLYLDPPTRKPTRLLAWRATPFTDAEEAAIRHAASMPFSLGHRENSSKGQRATKRDPWKVHCVPLDSNVPPPPGLASNQSFPVWESLTPYVPPKHAFGRRGKARVGKSPQEQLQQDLERIGLRPSEIVLLGRQNLPLDDQDELQGEWVKVHAPRGTHGGSTNLSKLGFRFRITFAGAVPGPLALGHSSHFGLGLFLPVARAAPITSPASP